MPVTPAFRFLSLPLLPALLLAHGPAAASGLPGQRQTIIQSRIAAAGTVMTPRHESALADWPAQPALMPAPIQSRGEQKGAGQPLQLARNDGIDMPMMPAFSDPAWMELDAQQQAILAPFAPEWNTWPAAEKHAWLAFAERFPGLSQQQRDRAVRRTLEWANMSPAERGLARANYRHTRQHPAARRALEWQRYQAMPESERDSLRQPDPSREISAASRSNGYTGLAREISTPIPGLMPAPARPARYSAPPATETVLQQDAH